MLNAFLQPVLWYKLLSKKYMLFMLKYSVKLHYTNFLSKNAHNTFGNPQLSYIYCLATNTLCT